MTTVKDPYRHSPCRGGTGNRVSVIDNAYGCWATASEGVSFAVASTHSTSSGWSVPRSGVSRPCHLAGTGAPGLLVNQKVSVRSIDVSAHRNSPSSFSHEGKSFGSTQRSGSSDSSLKYESRRTPSLRRGAPEVTSVEFFDYLIAIGGL